jgi:hypothetical protein
LILLILIIITLLSLTVAAATSIVAWRAVRNERRRSEARVTALAADIHGRDTAPAGTAMPTRSMFESADLEQTRLRLAVALGLGMLVVVAGAALAVVLGGAGRSNVAGPRSNVVQQPAAAGSAPVAPAPLELVALSHERDANTLTVRGVLRNPAGGEELGQLTAVVLLFNHDGGFVASGRAAVQAPRLGPGGETTFVITVPDVADVERYRVSFRTEDRAVPHVDLRG